MKNCSQCLDISCDQSGTNDGFAEQCQGYDPLSYSPEEASIQTKLDELSVLVLKLADDLRTLEDSFNRILCAIRRETQEM